MNCAPSGGRHIDRFLIVLSFSRSPGTLFPASLKGRNHCARASAIWSCAELQIGIDVKALHHSAERSGSPGERDSGFVSMRWGWLALWHWLAAVVIVLASQVAGAQPLAQQAPSVALSGAAPPRTREAASVLPQDSVSASASARIPSVPANFSTFNGGWIRLSFPRNVQAVVEPLLAEADSFRESLRASLGHPVLDGVVTVRIARTAGEMASLAPVGSPYPKYASGVAYSSLELILLTVEPLHPNSNHNLTEVFRHELAHIALHDAVGPGHRVPTWLNEGLAVHLSGENSLRRMQSLSMATLSNRLFPLHRLANGFPDDSVGTPIAYAQSADVVRQLLRREERPRFISMLARIRAGQTFKSSMMDAYGLQPYGLGANSLEDEWRRQVAKTYSFWPVLFGGSFMWTGVLGLLVIGYRRRRKRHNVTLARWAVEEHVAELSAGDTQRPMSQGIQIIVSRDVQSAPKVAQSASPEGPPGTIRRPVDVPKVEHDGNWHTLH